MSLLRFIAIFTILVSSVLSQSPIAVLDFSADGISLGEARTLTNRLRTELFNTGKFTVIERGMMDEILQEQGLQQSGCTSTECIVEAGRLIGVEQMVGGSIGKVGYVYSISARIISVETGQILRVATYDHIGELGDLLRFGIKNVALILAGEEIQETPVIHTPTVPQISETKVQITDSGVREKGISVNPIGFISQILSPAQVYFLSYEQMITPNIAFAVRSDFISIYQEWDEGDYYGTFKGDGFGFGGSLMYYLARTGEMKGTYGEIAFEKFFLAWEDKEFDKNSSWSDTKTGEGGFAIMMGGGLKKQIKGKYFFNPSLLIGIGYMSGVELIAYPGISIGIKL